MLYFNNLILKLFKIVKAERIQIKNPDYYQDYVVIA